MKSLAAVAALSALAHETRLALFRLLIERGVNGLPAGTIAAHFGIPPSSLTFHIQHLHRAGLITQRRIGRQLIYAADFAAMKELVIYLTDNCCDKGICPPECAPAAGLADITAAMANGHFRISA